MVGLVLRKPLIVNLAHLASFEQSPSGRLPAQSHGIHSHVRSPTVKLHCVTPSLLPFSSCPCSQVEKQSGPLVVTITAQLTATIAMGRPVASAAVSPIPAAFPQPLSFPLGYGQQPCAACERFGLGAGGSAAPTRLAAEVRESWICHGHVNN
jgi:hypothetical protein